MLALRWLLLALLAACPLGLSAQRARTPDGSAVRIVRVSVPSDTGAWDYRVTLAPGLRALSATAGQVRGGSASVVLTLQLGSQLTAGRQQAGTVTFTRGMQRVETPVFVEVAAAQALTLQAAAALAVADAGEEIALLFTLRNDGNAQDSLALVLGAPEGWNAAVIGPRTLVLAPGAASLIRVAVRPPLSITAGGTSIQLSAVGRGISAQAQTIVEVGATREQAATDALRVNSSVSYLTGNNNLAKSVASMSVAGPLLPGVEVSGELVTRIDQGDARAIRGASTIGLPVAGSRLRFSGTRGSVEFGRLSVRLPELAGRAVGGDGVALTLRAAGQFGAVAVTDESGEISQGALTWAGGRGPLTVEAAAVRLRGGFLGAADTRALDALSVGARVSMPAGSSLGVEVAERTGFMGRDLGMAADFQWQGRAGRASVRAQHAPGGSSALALARDAVNAETMLKFGESWALNSYAWHAQDGGADAISLSSTGGAVNPARRIGRDGEIGLLASMTEFTSANAQTEQASRDLELGVRVVGRISSLRWDLEGTTRSQQRETRMQTVTMMDRADRLGVRSGLTLPSRIGAISVRGGYAQANATQASEASFEVQASELRPIPALPWLTLDGTLQRSYLGRAAMDQAQLSARAFLPGDITVQLGLVRESWTGTQLVPSRSTVALRISRAARLAGAARWRVRTGVVFEDLDDDGTRDDDEPAVSGVTLRSGQQSVTTDREGRFRLEATAAAPEIDVRTLRLDQRPGSVAASDRWAIPVRTVGRLAVVVRRRADPLEIVGNMRPKTIIVSARNAAGAEWRATLGRDGIARFDALPVGAYTITAEDADDANALRMEARTVTVHRGSGLPGTPMPEVELVERDRPVRLQGGGAGLGVGALRQQQMERERQQQQQQQQQQERQQQERNQQDLEGAR